jgi:hypothetical protein
MTGGAQKLRVPFSVLPSIDEGDLVVNLSSKSDSDAASLTAVICECSHAETNSRREFFVVSFSDPFMRFPRHLGGLRCGLMKKG